jgi:hypothetical protein
MANVIDLLRPDDLVALQIEPVNLKLDTKDKAAPKLVVDKKGTPSYLVVHFPPQSILEQAFFETQTPPAPTDDTPNPPGSVGSRISGESRLVFKVPASVTQIPYTIASLLDWSKLELVVSPLAESPSGPITAPTDLQTAIEMPYRLVISPKSNVAWAHATQPVGHAGRTELWHTRIGTPKKVTSGGKTTTVIVEAKDGATVPVRAIWSPDYPGDAPLPTGDGPFLAPMTPRDRAQIVILTCGTTGYYVTDDKGNSVAYVPEPVQASRIFLSALGGWLSSRGEWPQPPNYNVSTLIAPFKPKAPKPAVKAPPAAKTKRAATPPAGAPSAAPSAGPVPAPTEKFPPIGLPPPQVVALDLVEWVHLATQGRDHYVKIVYEGVLYPFGHKAALIKITERKIVPAGTYTGAQGTLTLSTPTAYLKQRMYIVVREKVKTYDPSLFAHAGRELPFLRSIEITTKVTPDIDKPTYIGSGGVSFWVYTGGKPFQFHVTATDLAGATHDFLAPLIFMDIGEPQPSALVTEYATADSGARRTCAVPGRKIAYADPSAGDTVLKTSQLFFTSELLETSPPYTGDPFVPTLDTATVEVPAIEELLGSATGVPISLYAPYLASGIDANAGVFAVIGGSPPLIKFSADKGGGFAMPNLSITAISARKGVVAGSADDAAAGLINPSAFFDLSAQLFGAVPLQDLIPVNAQGKAPAAQNAPEIRSHTSPSLTNPQKVTTTVSWSPAVQTYPPPPAPANPFQVQMNSGAALSLTTKIVRDLTGGPSSAEVSGQLTSFAFTFEGVIGITFDALKFSSKNGAKTVVKADLPSSDAVGFLGPLAFVQKLADILPAGIFGKKGPSITLAPDHVAVSLTIGIPPISIGVFTLEHIAITVGLDLPYLDGKPAFEFAFASRGSPFLLTVECLGGGGFVHVVVDADGVEMVEGALEFGGHFSFDIGVASGGVHAMAGIYFQLKSNFTDLTGFVDIGGEVSILGIISISMDLNLSLSWQDAGGKQLVTGKATLSLSIHIIFFSISVSVSVEKSFGSKPGDPSVKDVITAADWSTYAAAFA